MLRTKTDMGNDKVGQIVFIGASSKKSNMLVLWTERGSELEALDRVRYTTNEKLWVWGARSMTATEVKKFRAKQSKSRVQGYWYKRNASIMSTIRQIDRENSGD